MIPTPTGSQGMTICEYSLTCAYRSQSYLFSQTDHYVSFVLGFVFFILLSQAIFYSLARLRVRKFRAGYLVVASIISIAAFVGSVLAMLVLLDVSPHTGAPIVTVILALWGVTHIVRYLARSMSGSMKLRPRVLGVVAWATIVMFAGLVASRIVIQDGLSVWNNFYLLTPDRDYLSKGFENVGLIIAVIATLIGSIIAWRAGNDSGALKNIQRKVLLLLAVVVCVMSIYTLLPRETYGERQKEWMRECEEAGPGEVAFLCGYIW